jgi:hypothetical protein
MDFYSKQPPNLIGPVMKETLNDIIKSKPEIHNTVSDKLAKYVTEIYTNYISPNMIFIIIAIIFGVFLYYRWQNRSNSPSESKEDFQTIENNNLLNEIEEYQLSLLKHDNPPSMNPIVSVNKQNQNDIINYPPDRMTPFNAGEGRYVQFPNQFQQGQQQFPVNDSNYDFNNVYSDPTRSYYNGTYNTYQNAHDTDIQNPYGWSNNFNTNSGNFVNFMTSSNNANVTDLNLIEHDMQGTLIESLRNAQRK